MVEKLDCKFSGTKLGKKLYTADNKEVRVGMTIYQLFLPVDFYDPRTISVYGNPAERIVLSINYVPEDKTTHIRACTIDGLNRQRMHLPYCFADKQQALNKLNQENN